MTFLIACLTNRAKVQVRHHPTVFLIALYVLNIGMSSKLNWSRWFILCQVYKKLMRKKTSTPLIIIWMVQQNPIKITKTVFIVKKSTWKNEIILDKPKRIVLRKTKCTKINNSQLEYPEIILPTMDLKPTTQWLLKISR